MSWLSFLARRRTGLAATAMLGVLFVAGCNETCATPEATGEPGQPEALAIGDSVLEWNRCDGTSIPDVLGSEASLAMTNAAIGGTRVLGGEEAIPEQYQPGDWQLVLVNGGANDIGPDGCGCGDCLSIVDALISADASTGAMVELLDTIRSDVPLVVLLGYYSPAPGSEFAGCDEEAAELNARYEQFAELSGTVVFVDATEAVDPTMDRSLLDEDGIHPSTAGSAAIGALIAQHVADQ